MFPPALLEPSLQTPVLVYDEADLSLAYDALQSTLAHEHHGSVRIYFTIKCCYRPSVAQLFRGAGAGVEVMSWTEYQLARAAGFTGPSILCNGLGRSREMAEAAHRDGARAIIDTLADLRTLLDVVDHAEGHARVGVRARLDLSRFPKSPFADGLQKLGWHTDSADLREIIAACDAHPRIELDLLHVHVGSVERESAIYLHAIEQLRALKTEIESAFPRVRIRSVDLGGGYASFWRHELAQPVPMFAEIGAAFARAFGPDIELILEPGRYLVEAAAYAVATVTAVKRDRDRTYVVLDAGTNSLMPFGDMSYTLLHPPRATAGHRIAVVDGITSRSSVLIADTYVTELLQPGDRVIIGKAGAYTTSLYQFFAFDPMPVAMIDRAGRLRIELSREDIAVARRALFGV